MKGKYLFFAGLACTVFAACSSDENVTDGALDANTDQAYVAISLNNATGGMDGRGTDGGLQYGVADENAVSTAEFYFYNADGAFNQYVSKPLTWTANTGNTAGNVEKFSNATVVLQNLAKVGKPKYVVCVLNGAAGAYKDKTLTELKAALSTSYLTGDKFIMTNSTYNNSDATSQYFATVMNNNNFLKEKPTEETLTDENAVQIYVERLASKVTVNTATNLLSNNELSIGNYDVDGVVKNLKIKVLGWGLNALNKNEYVEKHVPAWETKLGDFTWDAKGLYRSYWACSPNYGGGTYPASFANVVDASNSTDKQTVTNADAYSLQYVSWKSLNKSLGSADYCMENTNTADELKSGNFKAKVTHVLLKAQTVGGEDLIRYDGRLYTEQNFLNRILSQLNMSLYTKSGETYTQIATSDLAVVNTYDGTVDMALTTEAAAKTWYVKEGENYTVCDVATINAKFEALDIKADYYKNGMMYYCVPIEHLRGGKVTYNDNLSVSVNEADYGVVRNHHYVLSINKIQNLGTAVYNPDEQIVPVVESPTYYVGAKVNILSWKVVNQSVEL